MLMQGLLKIFAVNPAIVNSEYFQNALHFFFYFSLKVFLMLSLIIFLASIIKSFFPPERTRKLLGDGKISGILGNIFASLLGVVTPFCSCSAVSLFIGFIEAGIPLGMTFSFLIAAPMINEVALVMLWSMFGWQVSVLYVGAGLIVAVLFGLIVEKFKMDKYVEDYVYQMKINHLEIKQPSWLERINLAKQSMVGIIGKLWLYILIGIAMGAIIHGWFPAGWLSQYTGRNNPFAVIIAVLIGIPLYSNPAGTIPIIKELTRLGMPLGTALSFMMSVTALSLPEIIILRKVIKPKLLGLFVSILAISIVILGYLFNNIFD